MPPIPPRTFNRCLRFLPGALLVAAIPAGGAQPSASPATGEFVDVAAGLTAVSSAAAAFGDCDNDGDLDLIVTGDPGGGSFSTRLYRNDPGPVWNMVATTITAVRGASTAWGDYDRDGDLDLAICGYSAGGAVSRIYRNDGGLVFSNIAAGLTAVGNGALAWGDADNDGDPDLLLAGASSGGRIARLYRNDGGLFIDAAAGLTPVSFCAVAWGDLDRDGDLDILLTGEDTIFTHVNDLYRNDGGAFVQQATALDAVNNCSLTLGDADNDGDPDVGLAGHMIDGTLVSHVYRNDGGGAFSDLPAGLPPLFGASLAWGDADDDGDPDLLLSGQTGSGSVARVYRNDGGAFAPLTSSLPGVSLGVTTWGDIDGDGDLDLLVAGGLDGGGAVARLYRNDLGIPVNAAPGPPSNLNLSVASGAAVFRWSAGVDDHTPPAGLTYNLRIGTTIDGVGILPPMADPVSGFRRVPATGNAGYRLEWSMPLSALPPLPIAWSVQAIDGSFRGSPFAPASPLTAVLETPPPPSLEMEEGRPNPFRDFTVLRYALAYSSDVDLSVFDAGGRRVARLVRGTEDAGPHEVRWNGRCDDGEPAAAGVYLARLEAGRETRVRKLVVRP